MLPPMSGMKHSQITVNNRYDVKNPGKMDTLQEFSREKKTTHLFGISQKVFMNMVPFELYHERQLGSQKLKPIILRQKTNGRNCMKRMWVWKALEHQYDLVSDTGLLLLIHKEC